MRFAAILLFGGVFLFSCQKEVHFANTANGNGINSGSLLTKIVSRSGSDSSTLLFGYNSSNMLVTLDAITVSSGTTSIQQERVERNAQGMIERLIIKDDQYQQAGLDSVITTIGYTSGRYVSKVTTIDLSLAVVRDSVSLVYDGNGKVVTERTFDDVAAGVYSETSKTDYTYAGNNIATINYYSYDASNSSYSLLQSYTYDAYDDKVSPMSLGNEAFVFDSPAMFSANNPTQSAVVLSSSSQTYVTSYTYNSANRPLTATSTIQPGNSVTTATYYYQ